MRLREQRQHQHHHQSRQDQESHGLELAPPQPSGAQRPGGEGSNREAEKRRQVTAVRQLLDDLRHPAHQPPHNPPGERSPNERLVAVASLRSAAEQPSRRQAGHGEQQRAQEVLVGYRQGVLRIGEGLSQVLREGRCGQHL